MGKKLNFLVVLIVLVLVAAGNVYVYFNNTNTSITGSAISNFSFNIKKLDASTIIFLIQWLLILVIVIIFYAKFLKSKREEHKKNTIKIKTYSGKGTTTDLDTLYDFLKKRKSAKISSIAKSFKVNNDMALDWCKILENSNLINIEYPAFSEPEVMVK